MLLRLAAYFVPILTLCTTISVSAKATPPNVLFILLDTTRADHMSAWGYQRNTTPHLDALARRGVRFARHFANSHATRPSMPQLMSGRYYLPSILREFRPTSHPRDWPFNEPDRTVALLPELLTRAGYRLEAVSAHPWVARASRFGEPFDDFEEPSVPAGRGHVDADVVVERAIARWTSPPGDQPLFLYLHFMDAHIPRVVPPGALRFGAESSARSRFDSSGEPDMGDPWHEWDRSDARAFGPEDIAFFEDVYDTMLAKMDEQLGRLFKVVLERDPELRRTVVLVVADHGEELGEHGRISHEDSLDDGIQHIPWILAGRNVVSGRTAWELTENVDVVPTLLDLLGVSAPAEVRFDGRVALDGGKPKTQASRSDVVYAWEDYRAIRLGSRVVRDSLPGSIKSHCGGRFVTLGPDRRVAIASPDLVTAGPHLLARRLDAPQARFETGRFGSPRTPLTVLPAFWGYDSSTPLACVRTGPDTPRDAFAVTGWIWTGRGLTVQRLEPSNSALTLRLSVPAGEYQAELGVRDLPPPPRLFGYGRWLRKSVRRKTAKQRVPLGDVTASADGLALKIPPRVALGRHVLSVHLTPRGYVPDPPQESLQHDPGLRRRLRSLGYVE